MSRAGDGTVDRAAILEASGGAPYPGRATGVAGERSMSQAASGAPHWADAIAERVVAEDRPPVLSTGISPSGEIHIGNMREVLTADAVYRALRDRGVPARFNFVSDQFDPLRKVYPFLDASIYEPLVGRPLSDIPSPCGDHASYAEHFLEPFLESLRTLRVDVEVERADALYRSGRMNGVIARALERRDAIVEILRELTGKQMGDDWSPFTVLCPECGKMGAATVTGFSASDATVAYACPCGTDGDVPMAGGGKLQWRIDWPARWSVLGVTVEPFGKDHATRGGSYDTGVRIAREVFEREPPFPVPYEWIRLKGRGDMSSSRGNVLSIADMLEVVPPEVLRYFVLREKPAKTLQFDPGLPLLQIVDEVDDGARAERVDARALELSRAGGFEPVGVPFRHLVVVAQAARFDPERVERILARTGYAEVPKGAIEARLPYASRWLERFAPEDVRFTVRGDVPEEASSLDDEQRAFLAALADALAEGVSADAISSSIQDLARAFESANRHLFQAIYVALLGKPRGPRAAPFIEILGAEFCAERFRAVARSAEGQRA